MDKIYQTILTQISTKSDAEELSSCIDAILESFYQTKKLDYKKIIDQSLNVDLAEVLKKAAAGLESSKITEFLTPLKEIIQKLKIIKLTIAFSPTPDCIKTISVFIKERFGEEFIIDIEQDPKILGGAIIANEGIYQDLSLKKQLDEVFEKRKKEIIELIQ